MATEEDYLGDSLQMQFQSTEENGEIATSKLEDSLEKAEMDISRFFAEATDDGPAVAQKRLAYQLTRPNFEFLEGRSRSTLIYRRLRRPSTRDRKTRKRGRCENLSAFGWVFLSLALLQSKWESVFHVLSLYKLMYLCSWRSVGVKQVHVGERCMCTSFAGNVMYIFSKMSKRTSHWYLGCWDGVPCTVRVSWVTAKRGRDISDAFNFEWGFCAV